MRDVWNVVFAPLVSELHTPARLQTPSGNEGVQREAGYGGRRGTLPKMARLTEAISSVLDDYTMVILTVYTVVMISIIKFIS